MSPPIGASLRGWLDHLQAQGRLAVARPDVDLRFGVAGIANRLDGRSATLFPRPGGHPVPVVSGLLSALALVLLPSERIPLHIFEERYQELIGECLAGDDEFGLVYADDDGIREIGTRAGGVRGRERVRGRRWERPSPPAGTRARRRGAGPGWPSSSPPIRGSPRASSMPPRRSPRPVPSPRRPSRAPPEPPRPR